MSYREVAQSFGDLVASRDYSAAWGLLSEELRATITPGDIQAAVATMIAYAHGPIQHARVIEDFILENWQDQQPGDLAVVYVALTGEDYSEAVTLTMAQIDEDTVIRDLQWGRP